MSLSIFYLVLFLKFVSCKGLMILLVTYRSHHEKLVIVDHRICFIGGLDLCFGRYDTNEHKVGDCPPLLWPGKDYYNPRYILIFLF